MQEHAACVQVVDNELCQLVLHTGEGADQCVDQHAVKHTEEVTVLVVLLHVEEAGAVEESQLRCQVLSTAQNEHNVKSKTLSAGGTRVQRAGHGAF